MVYPPADIILTHAARYKILLLFHIHSEQKQVLSPTPQNILNIHYGIKRTNSSQGEKK
jgi:hypothetical protein